MSRTTPRQEAAVCFLLFLAALLPRVLSLNTFITWDELFWTLGSIRFLVALREGNLANTFVIGQPGVVTMWVGAVVLALQGWWTNPGAWAELVRLGHLDYKAFDQELMRAIVPFWDGMPLATALLTAATVVGVYLLGKRLLGQKMALLGALLLAWDPFYLAHSRVMALDAVLSSLMILSVLCLLIYLGQGRSAHYLVLAGLLAGLAVLNKTPALFLALFSALAILVYSLRRSDKLVIPRWRDLRQALLASGIWGMVAGLTYFALWPAMWADPPGTLRATIGTLSEYVPASYEYSFFRGSTAHDPGPWFYPFVLAFRSTPLTLLGLVATPLLLQSNRGPTLRASVVWLLAYALLFGFALSLVATKFERYLLPIFPALDLVAAAGLVTLAEQVHKCTSTQVDKETRISPCLLVYLSTLIVQAVIVLPLHPYYLAYYNPLVGGAQWALQTMPVGWGEGMDQVACYLNRQEGAAELAVATWGVTGLGPLFRGQVVTPIPENLVSADYVVVYIGDVQQKLPVATAFHGQERPEHTVRLHGIEYAWVYRNTRYVAPLGYLESHAQPGDAILLSKPSLLAKHYHGDLPLHILSGDNEAEIADELISLSARRRRIWYISYPNVPSQAAELARYQLDTHAYRVEEKVFPDTTVSCYLLPKRPGFRAMALRTASPPANFANQLILRGYGLAEEGAQWGKAVGVALAWQAARKMDSDYVAFVHLVNGQGHLWGQDDRPLRNAAGQPTSAWAVGDSGLQRHAVPLLPGIPPGRYWLRIGLYRAGTGERLSLLDDQGAPAGTEYTLGPVQVARSPLIPAPEKLAIPISRSQELPGGLKLLGYGLSAQSVKPGQTLSVTLFWQALRRMARDYLLRLGEFPLAGADYPTSRWREGEVLRGWHDLKVAAEVLGGEGQVVAQLLDSTGQPLLAEPLPLARVSVEALQRHFTIPKIQYPQLAHLGHAIALLGYDLDRTAVRPGETLHLTLYWQAQAKMETRLRRLHPPPG